MIKLNTQNRLDYDVLANFMDNYIWYKFLTHVSNNFSIRAWYKSMKMSGKMLDAIVKIISEIISHTIF